MFSSGQGVRAIFKTKNPFEAQHLKKGKKQILRYLYSFNLNAFFPSSPYSELLFLREKWKGNNVSLECHF